MPSVQLSQEVPLLSKCVFVHGNAMMAVRDEWRDGTSLPIVVFLVILAQNVFHLQQSDREHPEQNLYLRASLHCIGLPVSFFPAAARKLWKAKLAQLVSFNCKVFLALLLVTACTHACTALFFFYCRSIS